MCGRVSVSVCEFMVLLLFTLLLSCITYVLETTLYEKYCNIILKLNFNMK